MGINGGPEMATKAKPKATTKAPPKRTTKAKVRKPPNPHGRAPKYGRTMRRVAYKWPADLEATIRKAAESEGVKVSCAFRRALLAYSIRVLGPHVVASFTFDLAERAEWILLAERDPDGVARRVFRD